MSISAVGINIFLVIFAMALVTLITRLGGVFFMSFIPLQPKVQRFIQAMSGSVLIALLAPMALTGDSAARLALLTTAIVMLLLKKPLIAITAGVLAAALSRAFY